MKKLKIFKVGSGLTLFGLAVSLNCMGNTLNYYSNKLSNQILTEIKNPKIKELDAWKCPAYKTYVIKKEKHIKEYGGRYAKTENNRLKRI